MERPCHLRIIKGVNDSGCRGTTCRLTNTSGPVKSQPGNEIGAEAGGDMTTASSAAKFGGKA